MDIRIPKIRIRTRQQNTLQNCRIVVRINSWEEGSQYPNGHYVRTLGEIGDLDVETEALLIENQITFTPFSPASLKELPLHTPQQPYQMTKQVSVTYLFYQSV